jgi:hypothetical protein
MIIHVLFTLIHQFLWWQKFECGSSNISLLFQKIVESFYEHLSFWKIHSHMYPTEGDRV